MGEGLASAIEAALRSSTPVEQLRRVARDRLVEGHEHDALYGEMERFVLAELRPANREADEDIVFDVMDCLIGWCGPDATV